MLLKTDDIRHIERKTSHGKGLKLYRRKLHTAQNQISSDYHALRQYAKSSNIFIKIEHFNSKSELNFYGVISKLANAGTRKKCLAILGLKRYSKASCQNKIASSKTLCGFCCSV